MFVVNSIIFRIALLLVIRAKPCEEYTEREIKRSSSMKMPFNIDGHVRWFYESVLTKMKMTTEF